MRAPCVVEGCHRTNHGYGYCLVHYKRLRRNGKLETIKAPNGEPIWYRLARRLRWGNADCWLWTGAVNHAGYGILSYERKHWLVHRLVYTLLFGPTDCVLHHLCKEPLCANPRHLQPLTRAEHLRLHAIEGWA